MLMEVVIGQIKKQYYKYLNCQTVVNKSQNEYEDPYTCAFRDKNYPTVKYCTALYKLLQTTIIVPVKTS